MPRINAKHPPAPLQQSDVERGMLIMACGVLITPGTHAIAKALGDAMSAGQISWARFFFQLLFLAPLFFLGQHRIQLRLLIGYAVLGLFLAMASTFFFLALTYMPLADSAAIFFVEPLILTLICVFFLNEDIGWRRLFAIVIGFCGALIVIRPSFQEIGAPALLPLLAGFSFALFVALTRYLAPFSDARTMQFWACLSSVIFLSVLIVIATLTHWPLFQPSWPRSWDWGLLSLMGLTAFVVQMLSIQAIKRVPASILAPFQYLEILGAIILGVIFFNDLPDQITILGVIIIIGSGLYVFYRERITARKRGSS